MLERIHQLVKHATYPPESVIQLLEQTCIGTKGTLYQLLDTRQKIKRLHSPHFIYLERNEKAIGTVTLCERDVQLNGLQTPTVYIRYFAFDQLFQGSSNQSRGRSSFHSYFKALFDTSNFDPIQPQGNKQLYWAFIDQENARSFNMNVNFGFRTIGSFKTKVFSRVHPKNKGVERITEEDQKEVLNALQTFYKDFNFYSPIHLFEDQNYFVIRHQGEIVCGIQANPVHWRIKSLPGLTGRLMVRYAQFIPRIRKLIHPNDHRFLATEGLFWKEGFEHFIEPLLEGTLALTKHHSLLIWTDDQNSLFDSLSIKWGFIQRMKADNIVKIVGKFNSYTDREIERIIERPKYLSGFDMT